LLKVSFGQLRDNRTERGARAFFECWRRLEVAAAGIPPQVCPHFFRLWDGIAPECDPHNKVTLGPVEGVNNKIRVLQRRACGNRDEDYLIPSIIANFLSPLPMFSQNDPH
jgi:hypothetical protein